MLAEVDADGEVDFPQFLHIMTLQKEVQEQAAAVSMVRQGS